MKLKIKSEVSQQEIEKILMEKMVFSSGEREDKWENNTLSSEFAAEAC